LTGKIRDLAFLVLAFTFSGMVAIVADLDHPGAGMPRTSEGALVD
jgi:hypothetical protein